MFRYDGLWFVSPLIMSLVFGLLMAILVPHALYRPTGFVWATLSLYGGGFGLFLISKLSLVRQGGLMSFGSARMSKWYRWMYRAGYCLMGAGFFFTMALEIATRNLLNK